MEYWAGQALLNSHELAGKIGTQFLVSLRLQWRRLSIVLEMLTLCQTAP